MTDEHPEPKTFSEKWHEEKERKRKLKKEKKHQSNEFNPQNVKVKQSTNQINVNRPQKKSMGRGR